MDIAPAPPPRRERLLPNIMMMMTRYDKQSVFPKSSTLLALQKNEAKHREKPAQKFEKKMVFIVRT